jgi:hypothetical protein
MGKADSFSKYTLILLLLPVLKAPLILNFLNHKQQLPCSVFNCCYIIRCLAFVVFLHLGNIKSHRDPYQVNSEAISLVEYLVQLQKLCTSWAEWTGELAC